jgi:amino acid transporter
MAISDVKKLLIGSPLPTAASAHERLDKTKALAVFSSDALSSSAYATEEILLVLASVGAAGLALSWPIALAIALLLVIVATSYRQTIFAYPNGGGAYIVSKDNLGIWPGLTAGAALLIDYVLTVAVSVSAGTAALTSALPALFPWTIEIALLAILVITVMNLRGLRESGSVFAIPTYFFMGCFGLMITVGLVRYLTGTLEALPPAEFHGHGGPTALTWFVLLHAFASGCTALTGVEAISDGIPAFKQPESKNAATTLLWMVGSLAFLFLGLTFLAQQVGAGPIEGETVASQVARAIFGRGPIYFTIQMATAAILLMAANTSYADFPRLASWIARDGYLPRQLANIGDRLVFSNGIILLGFCSALLVLLFRGDTHALIPLYAVGVFLSFTLSQSGMVLHWWRKKTRNWQRNMAINVVGAIATAVVLMVIAGTKFIDGAWVVILLIPAVVMVFRTIHAHYIELAHQLSLENYSKPIAIRHNVIVPISGVHRGTVLALEYAKSISKNITAVTVDMNPENTKKIKDKWPLWEPDVPLEVLESPYRSINGTLLHYIDEWDSTHPGEMLTVVVPEFIPARWWHHFLHNQTAWTLRVSLAFRPRKVVTSVRYHLAE